MKCLPLFQQDPEQSYNSDKRKQQNIDIATGLMILIFLIITHNTTVSNIAIFHICILLATAHELEEGYRGSQ